MQIYRTGIAEERLCNLMELDMLIFVDSNAYLNNIGRLGVILARDAIIAGQTRRRHTVRGISGLMRAVLGSDWATLKALRMINWVLNGKNFVSVLQPRAT